jgi:hypothetical protein
MVANSPREDMGEGVRMSDERPDRTALYSLSGRVAMIT